GRDRPGGARHPRRQGLALPHTSDPQHLCRQAPRYGGDGARSLRRGAVGSGQNRGPPDLSAERGRSGASRPPRSQDHGLDGADGVTEIHERVARHYGQAGIAEAILAALAAAGKDVQRLTPADLAPIDEFHTRGRAATADLAKLLELTARHCVLDVGSGIGGPSRYLAHTSGCTV